ncbi:HepT-like ribonuclease domain-containing protein [Geminocystis herdmanii]|uniref:HepT-like ribonuclease domain-containing protein n=1 Tax=Geminocystis herdmanii TaxID=669359 RepID=UPI000348D652|nr:DUF86 domain-containing protein [Geminocystis herdmanii]
MKALNNIEKFTNGFSFNAFVEDEKTNFAVIHAIQIIGEATNKIPKEIQNKYSYIPWRSIKGMRNLIAHKYFAVNLKIIWNSIQNDLPILKPVIEDILKNLK